MTGRAPVVGIVGAAYDVPRHWGALRVTGTPRTYVDAVVAAGGIPVLLPLGGHPDALAQVDAVVLTGGGDVDPARYGVAGAAARDVDPERDEHELAVVAHAAALRLPLLGVCRGLQLLVVAHGGRLGPLGSRHVLPGRGHRVVLDRGSLLEDLLGTVRDVSSVHEQAVTDTGPSWRAVGRTDDGVVEACEWSGTTPWPALGVQWHPELDATCSALFGWLVSTARAAPPQARARSGSRATETSTVAGTSKTATTQSASRVPTRSPR